MPLRVINWNFESREFHQHQAMKAAEFWAATRQVGAPTAGKNKLDGDVIMAGQAVSLGDPTVIVATANVGHLSQFVTAELWQNIVP